MFYGFRVDKALLDIGIDANHISADFRREMKALGKASDMSPQEVALLIAARTPFSLRLGLDYAALRGWVQDKKVDPSEDTARKALYELGIYDLP